MEQSEVDTALSQLIARKHMEFNGLEVVPDHSADITILAEAMLFLIRQAPAGWSCGCGHTNGINLAVCAACERKPNGGVR